MEETNPKPKSIEHLPPPKAGVSGTFTSFEQLSDWLRYYDMQITGFRGDLILVEKRKEQPKKQETARAEIEINSAIEKGNQ